MSLLIVLGVSLLLGLRHATDPDHLAAVTTLVASGKERAARHAAHLGLTWGLGHATSLFVFGLPIVLYSAYLPESVQRGAETAVGMLIVVLGARVIVRRRRAARTSLQAYVIGVVHGMGGTAGVGLLLLATIDDRALAAAALVLFAFGTAVSMSALSTGFGTIITRLQVRRVFDHVAPVFGCGSLLFGVWYALGAQGVVPYVL